MLRDILSLRIARIDIAFRLYFAWNWNKKIGKWMKMEVKPKLLIDWKPSIQTSLNRCLYVGVVPRKTIRLDCPTQICVSITKVEWFSLFVRLDHIQLNFYLRTNVQGVGKSHNDAASVRTISHIPASCGLYYFEVRIISKGRDGYMGIGLTASSAASFKMNRLPGEEITFYLWHWIIRYQLRSARSYDLKFGFFRCRVG